MRNMRYSKIDLTAIADRLGDYIGIRADDELYERGAILPVSRRWDDGNPVHDCGDEDCSHADCEYEYVDGTCALQQSRNLSDYCGQYIYILRGDGIEYGNDQDEIILRDARVIARIPRRA